MNNNSQFRLIYILVLTVLLGYFGYCGYTGRQFLEFGSSSQWSPTSNPGPHHK
jgi:hypothetical protein